MERAGILRNRLFQSVCMGALACLFGLATFQKELNVNGDNGAYICLAKSLAKGEGLRFDNYPDKPRSGTFPLGYPLFLSLLIRAFGLNILVLKAAMVLVFAACMAIFYFLCRGVLAGKYLAAALALSLTNYWLLDNASINMSELFFMLFLLAGFLFFNAHVKNGAPAPLLLSMAFFTGSVFIRTIGIAAVMALLLFLAHRRRFGWALGFLAAFALVYVWHKSLLAGTGGYALPFLLKNPYEPSLGMATIPELAARVYGNVVFYMGNVIQMTLLSFMSEMAGLSPASVLTFSLLIAGLLLAYPWKGLFSSPADLFLRLFLVLYMGILFAWPAVWSGSRFIVPLIPFFYLVALQNLQWLGGRFLKSPFQIRAQNLILAVACLWSALNFGEAYRKAHTPLSEDWKDFFSMAEWAKGGTDSAAVFCARSAFLFHLKSGRLCVPIPFDVTPEQGLGYFRSKGVNYVAVDRFKWTGSTQRYVVPVLMQFPDRFSKAFSAGREGAAVFKFNPK